jgi:hypothetical protein
VSFAARAIEVRATHGAAVNVIVEPSEEILLITLTQAGEQAGVHAIESPGLSAFIRAELEDAMLAIKFVVVVPVTVTGPAVA